jgi:hypothetical protein
MKGNIFLLTIAQLVSEKKRGGGGLAGHEQMRLDASSLMQKSRFVRAVV